MDLKTKIIVAGDVRGNFKQLFQRVENVNKKAGPFEVLLCVGDFFGSDSQNDELLAYKNNFKQIPVPTFILGANKTEHLKHYKEIEDGEICSNLTYLGKRGLYTLSNGIKIVYLSGLEATTGGSNDECFFTKEDIGAVRNLCFVSRHASDYKGVDILLTSQWPCGIIPENENSSKWISYLCKEIRPRYHFCALNGKHYESPPFRIPSDLTTQLELCTRFISLADVGNATKSKYIYALTILPVEKMRVLDLIQKTTDEVNCPFMEVNLKECTIEGGASAKQGQYFFDMQSNDGNQRRRHGGPDGQHRKKPKIMNIDQEKCWFCLSSLEVEKHLVISIGNSFYLALAKGPINNYHVLIMSITHIQSASLLSDEDWAELTKFKNALREFFKSESQVVCFTERNYKSSHLQINVLGIEEGYSWKIKHAFEDKAEEFNLQFETLPTLTSSEVLPQGPYFVAELPDETTMITRQMKHFPLHFARDVFCSENLLNCDEKVNWKDCTLEKDEEVSLVKTFREKFSTYDFTL